MSRVYHVRFSAITRIAAWTDADVETNLKQFVWNATEQRQEQMLAKPLPGLVIWSLLVFRKPFACTIA